MTSILTSSLSPSDWAEPINSELFKPALATLALVAGCRWKEAKCPHT